MTEKWSWKMDWCKKHLLAPANSEHWKMAENAYLDDQKEKHENNYRQGSHS